MGESDAAMIAAPEEMRRALARLSVLMDYGYTIEHHQRPGSWDDLVALVNSDERLEQWYGEGWAAQYVLDALAEVDRVTA